MRKMYKIFTLALILMSTTVFAQKYTISGVVTSAETGEKLVGANVVLIGTVKGAASDVNGKYTIEAEAGQYTLVCSYIGYEKQQVEINLTNNMTVDFSLRDYQFSLSVTVIADRAKERETPVAFSNVEKKDMEMKLGSQDIPLVLNTTPSVYATMQGGGAGDGRVNVRGFNQTNVAIMINGVPVNDLEWGGLYWSNWDGVGDATASIQVMRGLSSVNLAIPSIGGTMNIISDPTSQKFGVRFKQEFGSGAFYKSTLSASSGMVGKFAFNALLVRKIGDGLIDKTWTDGYAYYFGASYSINKDNRIELYAIGAPQTHGQNSYRQNIGTYSKELAMDLSKNQLDYDPAALTKFFEVGRKYNENWNNVTNYNTQQYWNGGLHDRHASDYINERENYYHKPQVNLNWYSNLSSRLSLYTTAYYSGGRGGGSGTLGSLVWDRVTTPSQRVDWNATIARNIANATGSRGILRNSVNEQDQFGVYSKALYKISNSLNASVGIDWRTATVRHFREVRDLLGGAYYIDKSNKFETTDAQWQKQLGDKVGYNFTNNIDWIGGFGQLEYTSGPVSAYGMYGFTWKKYVYTNHFVKDATTGGELTAEPDPFTGWQAKGGASYRLNNNMMFFANGGYISSVPAFDNVINDVTGYIVPNPMNEKFISFEGGLQFNNDSGDLAATVNYYYTTWEDRGDTRTVTNPDGSEGMILISGINQRHQGLEVELAYQPADFFRFDAALSIGNWEYLDDVSGTYKDYTSGAAQDKQYTIYLKNLKVGDSPQKQLAVTATVFPIRGMSAAFIVRTYNDNYADFNPFDRTSATDRKQSWRAPGFTVCDFHFNYELPIRLYTTRINLFAHVFNVFDALYVQDATDNSSYNAYTANGKNHSADDAEVFLGLPRTFNVGLSIGL